MKITKKLISYILTIAVGATLLTLAIAGALDSFWSGMGASLLIMSILRLAQLYLYKTDKSYQEKIDTEVSDERNREREQQAYTERNKNISAHARRRRRCRQLRFVTNLQLCV